jgi:hypothetical protein
MEIFGPRTTITTTPEILLYGTTSPTAKSSVSPSHSPVVLQVQVPAISLVQNRALPLVILPVLDRAPPLASRPVLRQVLFLVKPPVLCPVDLLTRRLPQLVAKLYTPS